MSENCTHDCNTCGENCASRTGGKPDFSAKANAHSNVKHVIGVVSGKGGVGKSMVTSLMAVLLRRRGLSAAILDADVTGPSIPKAFGVHEQLMATDEGICPAASATGVEAGVAEPASGKRDRPRGLARPGHRRNGQAVLDGRDLGRRGLYVRGHAAGNGRRAADRVPVAARGRHSSSSPRPRSWWA